MTEEYSMLNLVNVRVMALSTCSTRGTRCNSERAAKTQRSGFATLAVPTCAGTTGHCSAHNYVLQCVCIPGSRRPLS